MMYRGGKILALAFAVLWCAAIIAGNSAHAAADPNKILRVAIEAGDDGFDPSNSTNYYSGLIEEVIFDRLLTYDYLAEPVKLVPMAAEMPAKAYSMTPMQPTPMAARSLRSACARESFLLPTRHSQRYAGN